METLVAVAAAYMVSFDKALLAIEQKRTHTHIQMYFLPLPCTECEDHRAKQANVHVQRIHPLGNTVEKMKR